MSSVTSVGVAVSCYLEAAARPLTPIATLVDGHARQLGDQGLGRAAKLRVLRRHAGQRAAIATDDCRPVSLFEFGQATKLVE